MSENQKLGITLIKPDKIEKCDIIELEGLDQYLDQVDKEDLKKFFKNLFASNLLLSEKVDNLQNELKKCKQSEISANISQSGISMNEKKKRIRKCRQQIERKFNCFFEDCFKSYGQNKKFKKFFTTSCENQA